MSRNRATGTAWETAICEFLRSKGWIWAERRALGGSNDRGDIAGIPGVVISAKAVREWRLDEWLREVAKQKANDGAAYGFVWLKRRGKTSPGDAYVVMDGDTFTALLAGAQGTEGQ